MFPIYSVLLNHKDLTGRLIKKHTERNNHTASYFRKLNFFLLSLSSRNACNQTQRIIEQVEKMHENIAMRRVCEMNIEMREVEHPNIDDPP